jgi:glycosyltransferase involved in cell wall biosynthesis
VQRRCVRTHHHAFCFSELHERRLRELGFRGEITRLRGLYDGPTAPATPKPAEPVVVFAGRHIREKQVPALVEALAEARIHAPELRATIFGDGPDRPEVLRLVAEYGLDGDVEAPGFVDQEVVERAFTTALCLALPSRREGYGLAVVESCARGTPVVVVAGPDNAATELVEDGVNGVIASSAAPADLSAAILRVLAAGLPMRESTVAWFARSVGELSVDSSLRRVLTVYRES